MTLTLTEARDLVATDLNDTALELLIDAVDADITRLGGSGYPMRFSGALLDIATESASGADTETSRNLMGTSPPIGDPLIMTTDTAVEEVSYTLAAIDSGAVTITIDGSTPDDSSESLSSLADGDLEELSFYLVTNDGRLELAFEDAETADSAMPDRVQWQVATAGLDAARSLLTGVSTDERIRIVIARRHAGLRMPLSEWQAATKRVAVACLRIAVTDEAVRMEALEGGDASQTRQYLSYSDEYRDRLSQVLQLTGAYFF